MLKVSVITPAHNRTNYLQEAIESFLLQDYVDKGLIVINDGHPLKLSKSFIENCKEFGGVTFCDSHKMNSGCASALNQGIKKSKGDLICVLADDDLLVGEDSLSKRVESFDIETEVVYTGFQRIFYDGKVMSTERVEPVDKEKIWERDYINIQTMMWRRNIHKKIGYFSEDLINNEDLEFKIRCLMECNVKAVDIVTAASRYHGANKSIVNRDDTLKCADILIKRMKKRYNK